MKRELSRERRGGPCLRATGRRPDPPLPNGRACAARDRGPCAGKPPRTRAPPLARRPGLVVELAEVRGRVPERPAVERGVETAGSAPEGVGPARSAAGARRHCRSPRGANAPPAPRLRRLPAGGGAAPSPAAARGTLKAPEGRHHLDQLPRPRPTAHPRSSLARPNRDTIPP